MFANLKLRNRMLLGYSVPIVLLVGLSWVAYSSSTKVTEAVKQTKISEKMTTASNDALIGINSSERAMRGYLIDRNEESIRDFYKEKKQFEQSVAVMSKTTEKAD